MSQQTELFRTGPRIFVDDASGCIVYYAGVFGAAESARLFECFERTLPWIHEKRWMYDRTVAVPRLIARFLPGEPMPPELASAAGAIETFLGTTFTSLSVQYYRDGKDSVAWHNDHTEELIEMPIVAVLSLGGTREMFVRSKAKPRRTFRCDLEPGSLFVMSGLAQDFWEHHIPKVRRPTQPRISLALRQRRTGSQSA